MKQRLNKLIKKLNNSMFDVAAAPMFIVMFGVPILLFAIVAGLLVLAFRALQKIDWEKKKQKDEDQ